MIRLFITFFILSTFSVECTTSTGIDNFFSDQYMSLIEGKRVGLITNHTGINKQMRSTIDVLKENSSKYNYKLTALFAPEHGIDGASHNEEKIEDRKTVDGIPIFSLHGTTRRPTKEMLKTIDVLIYDIQDIGSRSYTYTTTLFYAMEEAQKNSIPVIVLDRPNPINGVTIDGPMLEDKYRSMVGYINVPYCHGMTIGELARFFNAEYKVGCALTVVPMKDWNRKMTFEETGLQWVPTSPQIPEPSTTMFYPTTGILGELQLVNIGVGYTLPFKLIGAPWIDGKIFARKLNEQNYPGVYFEPFCFKPFFGRFAKDNCQGVLIYITNPLSFLPVSTQYLIIGTLKNLYPNKFQEALLKSQGRYEMFNKVNGTDRIIKIISKEKFIAWKLRAIDQLERKNFREKRQKYLLY